MKSADELDDAPTFRDSLPLGDAPADGRALVSLAAVDHALSIRPLHTENGRSAM